MKKKKVKYFKKIKWELKRAVLGELQEARRVVLF